MGGPRYAEGVYLLYEPPSSDPSFDIVFVHGVTGHPLTTWVNSMHRLQEGDVDGSIMLEDASVCWPRDWLPHDFPHARILSVGYEVYLSKWFGNALPLVEQSSIMMHKLRLADVGDRPVVFIAHSFGGLVVKMLLHQANSRTPAYTGDETADEEELKQYSNFAKIAEQTRGIVFYSTPHRGSKFTACIHLESYILVPSVLVVLLDPCRY
eukprot:TRINITY_DN12852_c0_g1_i10.p1 TRINITY_DN12852_c0_g1~~TRINITY_DN12852_c0_g1_i10.p1  ORF type:complete len:209 (-),score=35.39 TRINITY_DN12852_c0_g1_i10:484-1110(-)